MTSGANEGGRSCPFPVSSLLRLTFLQIKKAELHAIAELKAVEARKLDLAEEAARLDLEEAELAAEEAECVSFLLPSLSFALRTRKRLMSFGEHAQVLDTALALPPQTRRTPRPLFRPLATSLDVSPIPRQAATHERLQCVPLPPFLLSSRTDAESENRRLLLHRPRIRLRHHQLAPSRSPPLRLLLLLLLCVSGGMERNQRRVGPNPPPPPYHQPEVWLSGREGRGIEGVEDGPLWEF